MLVLTALVLVGGAAGDQLGRRRVFIAGIGMFAAASLWCGLSPGIGSLIAARAVQGIGAALLIPCSLAIIGATFDESERGKAIGTWAAFSAMAAAFGPILGGWIVDHVSWRWIFLINPFIALPTIAIALRHVPESRDPQAAAGLDWRGALLALGGLGSLVYGLIAAPERGVDAMVLGIARCRRGAACPVRVGGVAQPRTDDAARAVPLAHVQRRERADAAALRGTRRRVLLPAVPADPGARLFGDARGRVVPAVHRDHGGIVALVGRTDRPLRRAASAGRRTRRSRPCGFALLAAMDTSSFLRLLPPMIVLGLGMAITVAPLTTTVINAVPERQTGVASGINNAVASLASLLAVAILGAVALGAYNRALDQRLAAPSLSAEVRQAVVQARGKFAAELPQGEARAAAQAIVRPSLASGISLALWLAAALALLASLCAALTIGPQAKRARAGTQAGLTARLTAKGARGVCLILRSARSCPA